MKAKIILDGETQEIEVSPGDNLLEKFQEEGIPTPFGCTSGSCHACLAHLGQGIVKSGDFDTLQEEDKNQGYILTCQSIVRADSEDLVIDFDKVDE